MKSPENLQLNVARWQQSSAVNGPGNRFVLWVQGCPIRCPGCINEDFLPEESRELVSVSALASLVLSIPGIEGVTFSGGEPTVQAEGLAALGEQVRAAGLSVMCYSGYTLASLRARQDPVIDRLLQHVDILIDGPFVREQAAELLWRGSRNQVVHFLSDRYRHLRESIQGRCAQVEFTIGQDGFAATGIWPEGFMEKLQEILRQ